MTVCVAAICNSTAIICASDRMVIAGDVQYEPNMAKHVYLTPFIGRMVANDLTVHLDVLRSLEIMIADRLPSAPNAMIPVREVADMNTGEGGKICRRSQPNPRRKSPTTRSGGSRRRGRSNR